MKRFLLLIFLITVLNAPLSCAWLKPDFDEAAWREKVLAADPADLYAPNHDGNTFFNPWMPIEKRGFFTFLRWRLSPRMSFTDEEWQYLPDVIGEPVTRIKAAGDADFIFWVGHGTFFMRIGGRYWLTDPIFTARAVIPKRKTPPGISIDEMLAITGSETIHVLISHNHYDHLDKKSIAALPDDTRFYVPLGMKDFIEGQGKAHVIEMNWWDSLDLEDGTRLVCTPMQHWSLRLGQRLNTILWASFLIQAPDATIYFDGDGGYFIGYREIGKKFPDIDYALIPTTAYNPRWFMHYAHMNVDEALDAFTDLGASFFIPTQWGTFHLGEEPPGYPALDLKRTIAQRDLDPDRFLILDIGGLHIISE